MKRIFSLILCLLLVAVWTVPVSAADPEIIFADEPTGALNQTAASDVMDAFLEINREGTTLMMVTHDSKVASMCEKILYIIDGEIKGELKLGKFTGKDGRERELKTSNWLKSMGW